MLIKNIHPETYNYLMIIKANYMQTENEEKAIKLFNTTHKSIKKAN